MAPTHLKLEHIGEPLVRALLKRLQDCGTLGRVSCHSASTRATEPFWDVLNRIGLQQSLDFHENVQLQPLRLSSLEVSFDGLSRIDCVIEDGRSAAAMEIKLGTTRMSGKEFDSRFLAHCLMSGHSPPRISGNMIAVLDGRFGCAELSDVRLQVSNPKGQVLPVLQTWFVLLRRKTWEQWGRKPPAFQRPCHTLLLEELVAALGGSDSFDTVVRELIGDQFAVAWGLAE